MGKKSTKLGKQQSVNFQDQRNLDTGSDGNPLAKAKAVLLYSEMYSEDSSEDLSSPSCMSIEDTSERRLKWSEEIPTLQELEETMMQARAQDDIRQARMLRKTRDQSFRSERSDEATALSTFQMFGTNDRRKKSKGPNYSTGSDQTSAGSSFASFGEKGNVKAHATFQLK